MDNKEIESRMHELEKMIDHPFNDIHWLCKAMNSTKIENTNKEDTTKKYENDALATVGDSLLNFVIANMRYNKDNNITKSEITNYRKSIVSNNIQTDFTMKGNDADNEENNIISFAYNQYNFYKKGNPANKQVKYSKKHIAYLEAIIAAIYYDSNLETLEKWMNDYLIPGLLNIKIDETESDNKVSKK